jgi:hypothetical protein
METRVLGTSHLGAPVGELRSAAVTMAAAGRIPDDGGKHQMAGVAMAPRVAEILDPEKAADLNLSALARTHLPPEHFQASTYSELA